jgi:raffinose/stachyose/melibiose transport system substrate-binding protein
MEGFNQRFQEANPGVTVDMTVVNSGDMASSINTRTTANDVDVIDFCAGSCSAFSNGIEDYMGDNYGEKPIWQQLIEAGLLMDLTDEPFVANFDEIALQDATTFNDRVYAIPMGRVTYSGMFVNETLLADVGVSIPTTWSELVSVCEAVVDSGNSCMTVGGGDTWPIFVGASGILGSIFPDQAALAEGLWDGSIKWNEGKGLEAIQKFQTFSTEMLESGVTGFSHDEATARYAGGDVAFMPTGMWQAPNLEGFDPAFDWTYVPVPGSDTAADNQYLWGKYDMSWMISADTPSPDVAKAYLAALSEPAEYQAYLDAVGFLPTQPTASLNSKLGDAVADLVPAYRVGLEQYWVSPSGAGQWADGRQAASWFAPFNEWTDATELANQIQVDLEAGLGS